MKKALFLILLVFFSSSSISAKKNDKIKKTILSMSLREKVGQLFVVTPDVLDPKLSVIDVNNMYIKGVTKVTPEMEINYFRYPAGGFIIFGKNIEDEYQLFLLNSQLHKLNSIKPLIYVDEEGGSVARIGNNQNFNVPQIKPMYYIGRENNPNLAYKTGLTIGKYLKPLGFDVDFAPDADVLDFEKKSSIGSRSFSQDPEVVANMAVAAMIGLNDQNILSCFKHYPGHGACVEDTHFNFAQVNKNWKELQESDLIPFKYGIKNNVPFIMVAHINYPNIDKENLPATLSYCLLTEKLRKELKYDGIIITDAMSMGAIHNKYDDETAAVMAINAGVDIILMPFNYEAAFESIVRAVQNGTISEKRINESVYRILSLKKNYFKE